MNTTEYYNMLEELATIIKEEVRDVSLAEYAEEVVGDSQYVIYTKWHKGILASSHNPHTPEDDSWRCRMQAVYQTMIDDIQKYL